MGRKGEMTQTETQQPAPPPLSDLAQAAGLDMEEMDGRQRDAHSADIFARIAHFQLADQARAAQLYPFFQPVEVNDGPEAEVDGKRVIMLGSNNYLGLTRHPDVLAAAHAALDRWGPSMTGSRLLNGTSPVHLELEEALADFVGAEAAIVFSTGYLANLGTVSALVDRHGVSVLDRDVHASIYDAAGLALGKYVRFQHNDPEHLARVLDNLGDETPRLVIVDGAYSMGGDLAPLAQLRAVCDERDTRLLVDDAHAIGTVGPSGRGTHSHFELEPREDLVIGTFSKTLASVGGFCAGPRVVTEYIQHFSRPMLFTAALPPASAAAALAALRLIDQEQWRVQRVQELGARMRSRLAELGFDVASSETPIIPIRVGDEVRTAIFWRDLLNNGVYTNAVIAPAVPRGQAILRTSYIATHTDEQLERALEIFAEAGRRSGVID